MDDSALTFEHVSFRYGGKSPLIARDVSFSLPKNSFTVIVGQSGSGKSTLLRLALSLLKPESGTISAPKKGSMVFQNGALLPWLTALENVMIGLTGARMNDATKAKHAHRALLALGIGDLANRRPRDVSGGQRQRIGIARALVGRPEMLYLDEPFSALDAETTEQLSEELLTLHEEEQITLLMVSHSIEDAVILADRILVFADGEIAHDIPVSLPRPRRRDDPNVIALSRKVKELLPGS